MRQGISETYGEIMLSRGCTLLPGILLLSHLKSTKTDCGPISITIVNLVRARDGERRSLP